MSHRYLVLLSRIMFTYFVWEVSLYSGPHVFLKHRWCAWDLNPGPQDGRRRRNHGAMAATRSFTFLLYESQIQSRALSSWGTRTYEIVRLEWRSDTHFIAFYAILTYSIRIRTKGCVYGGILMSISIRLE